MSLLRVKDLKFSYRAEGRVTEVVRGVNFEIEEGDFVAIQGPSGSGKSTFLYLLGGLLKADSGQIELDGKNPETMKELERARFRNQSLGFVFQQFHLLPKLNLLENILLPSHYPAEIASAAPSARRKKVAIRARSLAEELGLAERLDHLPNQLSGGQQQRVAICRALLMEPRLILADEPTGNLDSRTADQILDLFTELNRKGHTIILITHDPEVARRCSRVFHFRDGLITQTVENRPAGPERLPGSRPGQSEAAALRPTSRIRRWAALLRFMSPLAWHNLHRNRIRSFLTMIGVTIGIAAVLAMITVGNFAKREILAGYQTLGANRLLVRGWRNWNLRATDVFKTSFQEFDPVYDIEGLRNIFPQVRRTTPVLRSWGTQIHYAGRTADNQVRLLGVAPAYFGIHDLEIPLGAGFSVFHVRNKDAVCILGFGLAQELFRNAHPVGEIIQVKASGNADSLTFACRIAGVLASVKTNQEWNDPNRQVFVPYTTFQSFNSYWDSRVNTMALDLDPSADIAGTGAAIKAFFGHKYGASGRFYVDEDAALREQMERFLTIFTVLLSVIALMSLVVGGIGIANMMLVSVSERIKEIGLRKAVGATDSSVRFQFLTESVLTCGIAGLLGLFIGFVAYESLIYAASIFLKQIPFAWVVEPLAVLLSLIFILAVGIASGIIPALRAEKLQVIEALRNE